MIEGLFEDMIPVFVTLYLALLLVGLIINLLILVSLGLLERSPISVSLPGGGGGQRRVFVHVLGLICAADLCALAVGLSNHCLRLSFNLDLRVKFGLPFCIGHVFATHASMDVSIFLKIFLSAVQVIALYPSVLTYKRTRCPHADWLVVTCLIGIAFLRDGVEASFMRFNKIIESRFKERIMCYNKHASNYFFAITESGCMLLVYPFISACNVLFVWKLLNFRKAHRRLTLAPRSSLLSPRASASLETFSPSEPRVQLPPSLTAPAPHAQQAQCLSGIENVGRFGAREAGNDWLKNKRASKLAYSKSENSFVMKTSTLPAKFGDLNTEGKHQPIVQPQSPISTSPRETHNRSGLMPVPSIKIDAGSEAAVSDADDSKEANVEVMEADRMNECTCSRKATRPSDLQLEGIVTCVDGTSPHTYGDGTANRSNRILNLKSNSVDVGAKSAVMSHAPQVRSARVLSVQLSLTTKGAHMQTLTISPSNLSIDMPPSPPPSRSPSSSRRPSGIGESINANGCTANRHRRRDPYSIRRILPSVLVSNLLYVLCYLPFFIYSISSSLLQSIMQCNESESSNSNSSSTKHCSSELFWYQVSVTFVYVHHALNALAYVLAFGALRKNLLALLVALVPSPFKRLVHTAQAPLRTLPRVRQCISLPPNALMLQTNAHYNGDDGGDSPEIGNQGALGKRHRNIALIHPEKRSATIL